MMTKEEAIDTIINDYKDGNQSAMSDYCDRTKCDECPFDFDICVDEVNNTLIDRLLKAEEHQETNLEHYIVTYQVDDGEGVFWIDKESKTMFDGVHDLQVFVKWLLSPYKPPKYKLSKFEYDLLEFHSGSKFGFKDFWILEHMQDKGYFKGIPQDVSIRDILANCEVIANEID